MMEMCWDQKVVPRSSNHSHKGVFQPEPQSNSLCHLDSSGESGYVAPLRETPSVYSCILVCTRPLGRLVASVNNCF